MFIQTNDFQIIDCSRIHISGSELYSGTKYIVQAQPMKEPTDRGVGLIDLYQTMNIAEARKLVSLMAAHLNDGGIVIPLPELISKLKLEKNPGKEVQKDAV